MYESRIPSRRRLLVRKMPTRVNKPVSAQHTGDQIAPGNPGVPTTTNVLVGPLRQAYLGAGTRHTLIIPNEGGKSIPNAVDRCSENRHSPSMSLTYRSRPQNKRSLAVSKSARLLVLLSGHHPGGPTGPSRWGKSACSGCTRLVKMGLSLKSSPALPGTIRWAGP